MRKLYHWPQRFAAYWQEDLRAFDRTNRDASKVLQSHFFSAYCGTLVLRLPVGANAASFGVLLIGRGVRNPDTVLHEYGHRVQLSVMGWRAYLAKVAIPSLTAYWLHRLGKLPHDYYGSPWEHQADQYGGVARAAVLWPAETRFRHLLRWFFRRKSRSG